MHTAANLGDTKFLHSHRLLYSHGKWKEIEKTNIISSNFSHVKQFWVTNIMLSKLSRTHAKMPRTYRSVFFWQDYRIHFFSTTKDTFFNTALFSCKGELTWQDSTCQGKTRSLFTVAGFSRNFWGSLIQQSWAGGSFRCWDK